MSMKVDKETAARYRWAVKKAKEDPVLRFLRTLPGAERLEHSVPDKRPPRRKKVSSSGA